MLYTLLKISHVMIINNKFIGIINYMLNFVFEKYVYKEMVCILTLVFHVTL